MKSTLYTVLAACVVMLMTSGLVAFATAAPEVDAHAAADAYVSEMIDSHYQVMLGTE